MTLPDGLVRLGAPLPPEVTGEARLLARCAAARVRVPTGGVLLDGHEDLGPLRRGEHVLLRVAGTTPAVRVPSDRAAVLAAGLRTVRLTAPEGLRADVLVLRSPRAVHAGRADAGPGPTSVHAVEGEAHELDAAADPRRLGLPRLERPWQRAHRGLDAWRTPLPPWAMRLSRLVRDVQQVVGTAACTLTWVDDGRACHLVGITTTLDA